MTGVRPLLVIAGPTASGKTALAIELASRMGGEIISADSMQVYKGLQILTARPTEQELQGISCHLAGHVAPEDQYHLQRFVEDADRAVREIRERGKLPILCGGTGLYLRGFLKGIFGGPVIPPAVRRDLENSASTAEGLAELRRELASADPEAFRRIAPPDKIRLVRALEIWRVAGVPISDLQKQFDGGPMRVDAQTVILEWPTDQLNLRIEKRAHAMVQQGLLREIQEYLDQGYEADNPAFRALGASAVVDCIEGRLSTEELVSVLAMKTRQYAKRQRTWFRKEPRSVTLSMDGLDISIACNQVLDSLDCPEFRVL
jgi:tRNA dimethylallyltransferase